MYKDGPYLSADEKEIIDQAIEDYTWLPDVFALIRERMPERNEDDWLRVSQDMVSRLLKAGYVRLYWDDIEKRQKRVEEEIPVERHREVILERINWVIPPDSPLVSASFAIAATPEGERAMYD